MTMIHTLGTFYSIRAATNAYQGKVLGFVGDRRATKEPTPICLPQVKAWQWYTGQVNVAKDDFMEFFKTESNRTKWWTPASQLTSETKVPYLLALPNAMVEILREAGGASTPADVMAAMDEVMLRMGGGIMEDQWNTVVEWCLVASQADGNNKKSLLSIEVDSVAIDDDEFDTWVESKLDMALGRRPSRNSHHQGAQAQQPNHMNDQLNMARLLASTVGQGMLHFTQAVAGQTTAGAAGTLTQGATPLEMSKGFDKDQIAKLKDACGVMSAKDIPPIWSVIQATKGKAHDTYRDHLKKSIEAWCRSRHIERDKSIYLTAKFFEDLVALRFNPGGPVAQYESAARGISMLSCRSLSAVEAETQRGYEEATELTKTTRGQNSQPGARLYATQIEYRDVLRAVVVTFWRPLRLRNSSNSTASWTGRSVSRSGTRTPRRYVPELCGPLLTTGVPSLAATRCLRTSPRAYSSSFPSPASARSQMQCEMPNRSNAPRSPSSGRHQSYLTVRERRGNHNAICPNLCRPFLPRPDGDYRPRTSRAGNRGRQDDLARRTFATQKSRRSWIHTSRSTTTTSTCPTS